jgi:hypothetical protein
MAGKATSNAVKFIEEHGERYAVIPEKQFRDLIRLVSDLQDSLEMKEALRGEQDFLSLDELDKELSKAGLL